MAIALLHESPEIVIQLDELVEPKSGHANRRAEVRLSAEDASWLRGARLKYGAEVHVIDVSSGGILFESDGAAPAPHTTVVFELSGPTGTVLAPARILRSHVTKGTHPRFQAAGEFKRPLSIDALAAIVEERQAQTVTRQPAPVSETFQRTAWQRVVARFRNGRVVRGYTNDFHPSKPHLHMTPEDRSGDPTFVPLAALKAIFFVRDFAGDPERVDRTDFQGASHGRKVEVAFEDGEVLLGTTLAYRGDGAGFFVHPADSKSNNMRVFVSPGATLHVRFI